MTLAQACRNLPVLFVMVVSMSASGLAQQTRSRSTDKEDAERDQIVEEFIQFDIGNVRDPRAIERIKTRFNGLKSDDAVPALVRGMNRATRMRASCPITALAGKLRSILGASKDPEVGTYVLRNLEQRDVGQYNQHLRGVFTSAEQQVVRVKGKEYAQHQLQRRSDEDQQRLAYVPGLKLTDLAIREHAAVQSNADPSPGPSPSEPRPAAGRPNGRRTSTPPVPAPDLRKLSVEKLAGRLDDKASQAGALEELYRRASGSTAAEVARHADAIADVLKEGDDKAREAAARLLGLMRTESAVPQLIDSLEDSSDSVRSAASTALTRITRQLFGPSDNATPAETQRAVKQWRDWWSRQNADH